MNYWPKERFALIGQVERYREFLERFSELTGRDMTNTVQERQTSSKTQLSGEDRVAARRLLHREYEWYDRFVA